MGLDFCALKKQTLLKKKNKLYLKKNKLYNFKKNGSC